MAPLVIRERERLIVNTMLRTDIAPPIQTETVDLSTKVAKSDRGVAHTPCGTRIFTVLSDMPGRRIPWRSWHNPGDSIIIPGSWRNPHHV